MNKKKAKELRKLTVALIKQSQADNKDLIVNVKGLYRHVKRRYYGLNKHER